MQTADVAIVGAGVAGALCAALLGRQGYATCLIDPIHPYGADFRCEKLEHSHLEALQRAGLLAEILPAGRRYDSIWIARQGHLTEKRRATEYGIDYATLVNSVRTLLPADVSFRNDKVVATEVIGAGQRLKLASGDTVEARLVVGANGLSTDLAQIFGVGREIVSRCHSISFGFDVEPDGREHFDFDALTYFGEHPMHRVAYFTLFPIGGRLRANLFVYRELADPWLKQFRADPVKLLHQAMPRLKRLTGDFRVVGTPRMRPIDLVDTNGLDKPGLVMIGDAYRTACPASGTGASKAMVDAERLAHVWVPQWLQGDAISSADIAAFYADPVKRASDAHSREVSLFARRLALEPGIGWEAYRWARCAASMGRNALRNSTRKFTSGSREAGLQWQS